MMTKQEVFDKVVAHLRAQGRKALDEDRMCRYRASDGTKCAAGCLISDEHYSRDLEGKAAGQKLVRDALRASGVPEEADWLVKDLQTTHDRLQSFEWEERFKVLAEKHGLTYTALAAQ